MGFFLVIKAEVVRTFIIMRRYWFATLTGMFIGYGMLMAIIIGFMTRPDEMNQAIERQFSNLDPQRATNAALGFIIGMFAFGVVGVFTQGLQTMARSGQLEQLCLSPHGLVTNFLGRSLVGAISSIISSAIMLKLIALSVSGNIYFDPVPAIILLALTYLNLIGFGFMAGGLVLVFKQTGQIAVIVRMILLALGVYAGDNMHTGFKPLDWLMHAAPITDAAVCLKHVLIKNQMIKVLGPDGVVTEQFLSVFQIPSFYFLLINCAFWTVLGISLFKVMETWSRDKGTLGAY